MLTPARALVSWEKAHLQASLCVMATASVGSVLIALTIVSVLSFLLVGGLDLEFAAVSTVYLAPTTFVTALVCSWTCLKKRRDSEDATRACITAGLIGGAGNTVLGYTAVIGSVAVLSSGFPTPEEFVYLVMGLVVAALLGLVIGSPIGLIVALILLYPIRFGCTHDRSHDSLARSAAVCGTWSAIAGTSCAALVLASSSARTGGSIDGLTITLALCGAVTVSGIVMSLASRLSNRRRRLWLERVAKGECDGWKVARIADAPDVMEEGLRPFISGRGGPAAMLLTVLEGGVGRGAYRRADPYVPVATIPAIESIAKEAP